MSTETVLTDEQIVAILDANRPEDGGDSMALAIAVSRAIEQAVLQSEQVQAWKKDAERYRKLRAMATQQADGLGPIFRIDVRRSAPYLFNFDAAIDAAMEKQP